MNVLDAPECDHPEDKRIQTSADPWESVNWCSQCGALQNGPEYDEGTTELTWTKPEILR